MAALAGLGRIADCVCSAPRDVQIPDPTQAFSRRRHVGVVDAPFPRPTQYCPPLACLGRKSYRPSSR
eukprot:15228625-Alexandrium_andersonii.AAC.1